MTEDEWDTVVRVHLKGHAAPTHHAAAHWRSRAKEGEEVKASLVHTTSASGLAGNFGQANYGSAKLGILGLSRIAVIELHKYGVRSNAVSPAARTRLSLTIPGADQQLKAPDDEGAFDPFDPANVSPLIGWLAQADCPATGQVFHVIGDRLFVISMPQLVHRLKTDGRWTLDALDRELGKRLLTPPGFEEFFDGLL